MILASLVYTGEKTIGGTLLAAEETHHLARLNAMMETWSLDRLMCYQIVQESLALTTSVGSYTIGTGGAFNTARPTKIVDPCFIRDSRSNDYAIEIINAEAYGNITRKTSDGAYPSYLFYDAAFAASLATIFLWPEPSASLTLYINSWKQLQSFAAISTTVVLPPGYQDAIELNYAVRACVGQRTAPPDLLMLARQAKAAIGSVNAPESILRLDAGVGGRGRASNILTNGA